MLKAIFQRLLASHPAVLPDLAVPDPPVVKPHHDRAAALCFGGQHHVTPDHNLFVQSTSLHWAFLEPAFSWDILGEFTPKLPTATFLYHASDSSPPVIAA